MRIFLVLVVLVVLGTGGVFATLQQWSLPEPTNIVRVPGDIKRGAYLARLSGCVACHTTKEGAPLAGGVRLQSKFGTFISPNITPDLENGIGRWTFSQFERAVRQGISPLGHSYYPAFPFEFYAALSDRDISDIWEALKSVPPSANISQNHQVGFPFNIRDGLKVWRTYFSQTYKYAPDESRSDGWNRGKYLVEGPTHCAACHTPRNVFGGLTAQAGLAGDPQMLDGGKSPSLIASSLLQNGWTLDNLQTALRSGITPNGDVLGGSMAEVIHGGTSYLLDEHLQDMALYLLDKDQ